MLPETFVNALPFITLPITTRYFGLEEFGIIALFQLCQLPFTILCEYGVGYIIPGLWFDLKEKEQKQLLFSILFTGFVIVTLSIGILFPFFELIVNRIANDSAQHIIKLIPWLYLTVLFNFIPPVFSSWVVITERATLFSKIKLTETFVKTLFSLSLIVYTQDVYWVIIGTVIANIISNTLKLFILLPNLKATFKKRFYLEILRIGYPIFIRSLFNQVRGRVDKLFVSSLYSVQTFALYNWSLRFYDLFTVIDGHFSKVYSPELYQALSKNQPDYNKFRRIFFGWFVLIFFGCVCFHFIGERLIAWISNDVYTEAFPIILLSTIVFLIDGAFTAVSVPIIQKKKTKIILYMTMITSMACLFTTWFFVPIYGAYGGVLSLVTLASMTGVMGAIIKFRMIGQNWIELKGMAYTFLYIIGISLYFLNFINLSKAFVCITFIVLITHFFWQEKKWSANNINLNTGR